MLCAKMLAAVGYFPPSGLGQAIAMLFNKYLLPKKTGRLSKKTAGIL